MITEASTSIKRLSLFSMFGSVIACDKREAFAQGSNPLSRGGTMDCFAALAMTVK
jgi:hypothetical protein